MLDEPRACIGSHEGKCIVRLSNTQARPKQQVKSNGLTAFIIIIITSSSAAACDLIDAAACLACPPRCSSSPSCSCCCSSKIAWASSCCGHRQGLPSSTEVRRGGLCEECSALVESRASRHFDLSPQHPKSPWVVRDIVADAFLVPLEPIGLAIRIMRLSVCALPSWIALTSPTLFTKHRSVKSYKSRSHLFVVGICKGTKSPCIPLLRFHALYFTPHAHQ